MRLQVLPVAFVLSAVLCEPVMAGTLDGIGTCTLTVNASGTMKLTGDGTTMTSATPGGLSAGMLLVGVNLVPELVFSAPVVVGPPGWSATPQVAIAVETLSGTRTGYNSVAFSVRPSAVLDTLSVNARVTNDAGFKAGSYSVSSTVTCQSAS